MIKKFLPLVILISLSWGFGIYFTNKFYDPSIVIPALNNFYWVSPFVGLLALTSVFTVITAAIFYAKHKGLFKHKKWMYIHGLNHVFWMLILLAQTKVVAFNLGICH